MKNGLETEFIVRSAVAADVDASMVILNDIIEIGGTTAFQKVLTLDEFQNYFLTGDECVECFVALSSKGVVLGFQSLRTKASLDAGWLDIATFAQRNTAIKGVGRALFAATLTHARTRGVTNINATIRADNTSGLGYYSKMGFVDYAIEEGVPLSDGRPVDRISKVYML